MTLLHVLIIIGVSIRVIRVRLPVATSLGRLLLVFFLPPEIPSNPQRLSPQARSISRLAETTLNIPALSGNRLRLLDAAEGGYPGADLRAGETDVQVIPSGPGMTGKSRCSARSISMFAVSGWILR
jgi:hypothetical protein